MEPEDEPEDIGRDMGTGIDLTILALEPELGTFAESEAELSMVISAVGAEGVELPVLPDETRSTAIDEMTPGLILSAPGCEAE